jgi:hypothetical protein
MLGTIVTTREVLLVSGPHERTKSPDSSGIDLTRIPEESGY